MWRPPATSAPADAFRQTIKGEINHWCRIQSEHLAKQESAYNGDAQRAAQLRASASAEGERHTTQDGGHGGHEDRPEAQQTRLVDGVERRFTRTARGIECEVDHHDTFFLHDADKQ